MMSPFDVRPWLAGMLLVTLAFFAGEWEAQRSCTERLNAADGLAREQLHLATSKAKQDTAQLTTQHQAVDAVHLQEIHDAKNTIDTLRADVRSGAVSLSIATRALRAGAASPNTGTGYIETRSELMPEAAIELIDIAADGDDAVRDLNACIAKYDAVRRTVNP